MILHREGLSTSCNELVDRINVVTHSLEETTNIARTLRRENDELHFQNEDLMRQFSELRKNLEIAIASNSEVFFLSIYFEGEEGRAEGAL